jgi:hypothetical protein
MSAVPVLVKEVSDEVIEETSNLIRENRLLSDELNKGWLSSNLPPEFKLSKSQMRRIYNHPEIYPYMISETYWEDVRYAKYCANTEHAFSDHASSIINNCEFPGPYLNIYKKGCLEYIRDRIESGLKKING